MARRNPQRDLDAHRARLSLTALVAAAVVALSVPNGLARAEKSAAAGVGDFAAAVGRGV